MAARISPVGYLAGVGLGASPHRVCSVVEFAAFGSRNSLRKFLEWNTNHSMAWPVEYTDEFGVWWDTLTAAEQVSVTAHV